MAFAVRIIGHAVQTEKKILELEPAWWKAKELQKDKRFAPSGKQGGYLDYEAYLSVEETQALHERYRKRAYTGIYSHMRWQRIIKPLMQKLDLALYAQADRYWYFYIKVYEW